MGRDWLSSTQSQAGEKNRFSHDFIQFKIGWREYLDVLTIKKWQLFVGWNQAQLPLMCVRESLPSLISKTHWHDKSSMKSFLCSFSFTRGSCTYFCPQTQNLSQNTDSTVLYESKGNIFKPCKKEILLIFSFKDAFKPNF